MPDAYDAMRAQRDALQEECQRLREDRDRWQARYHEMRGRCDYYRDQLRIVDRKSNE